MYANDLVRFATGLVGPFDAQDVVTDGCLRAFSSKSWNSVDNPRAYLYKAVLNQARSQHRSTMRRRVRETRAASRDGTTVAGMDVAIDVDVLSAVDQLSVQQRAVVMLTYWEDLAPAQAASRLGISEGSVKRHLARARKKLKGMLDG